MESAFLSSLSLTFVTSDKCVCVFFTAHKICAGVQGCWTRCSFCGGLYDTINAAAWGEGRFLPLLMFWCFLNLHMQYRCTLSYVFYVVTDEQISLFTPFDLPGIIQQVEKLSHLMQTLWFLSTGLEGVVLSSSCSQFWHWRGHHLQCAVEAAEWRAGKHSSQGEMSDLQTCRMKPGQVTSWFLRPSFCGDVQVVVLWVGTNNYEHTAEQVAGGILAIVELLISCLPKAKIIVLVSWAVCDGNALYSLKEKVETGSYSYEILTHSVTFPFLFRFYAKLSSKTICEEIICRPFPNPWISLK